MGNRFELSIGFSRPLEPEFVTNVIMWKLGTNYSHAYIKLRDANTGKIIVFHADGPAFKADVHSLSMDNFLKTKEEIYSYSTEISHERLKEIWEFLWDASGTDYGEGQLIRILFNIKKDNGKKKYICSELVGRCLKEELAIDFDKLDRFTPKDLRERILLLSDTFKED